MKKLILLFFIVFTMFGCDISSSKECYQAVQETFPNATVFRLPDERFKFIVITDSASYYIETLSFEANITTKIRIK